MKDFYAVYGLFGEIMVSWIFGDEDHFKSFVHSAIPRDGGVVFTTGSVDDKLYDRVRPVIDAEVQHANQNGVRVDVDGLQKKIAEAVGSAQH